MNFPAEPSSGRHFSDKIRTYERRKIPTQEKMNTLKQNTAQIFNTKIKEEKQELPSSTSKLEIKIHDSDNHDSYLNSEPDSLNNSFLGSQSNSPQSVSNDSANHDNFCFICHKKEIKRFKSSKFHCHNCSLMFHRKHFLAIHVNTVNDNCPECHNKKQARIKSRFESTPKFLCKLLSHTVDILSQAEGVDKFESYIDDEPAPYRINFKQICDKVREDKYERIEDFEFDIRLVGFDFPNYLSKKFIINLLFIFFNRWNILYTQARNVVQLVWSGTSCNDIRKSLMISAHAIIVI